eukprot:1152522-Pelagomonas_calceolata.AAC.4
MQMFMYNSADGPQCNLGSRMNCSDGTLAPPLSLMGLDVDKVDVLPRSLQGKPRPKAFPDLLVPVFKVGGNYFDFMIQACLLAHNACILAQAVPGMPYPFLPIPLLQVTDYRSKRPSPQTIDW